MSVHAVGSAVRQSTGLAVMVGLVIFSYLAVVSIIPVHRSRQFNQRERITQRLMRIEMAKQEVAMQRDLRPGARLTMEELVAGSQYLDQAPASPSGTYEPGALGELPRFVPHEGEPIVPEPVSPRQPAPAQPGDAGEDDSAAPGESADGNA